MRRPLATLTVAALTLTLGACAGEPLKTRDVDEWLLTEQDKAELVRGSHEPGALATIAEYFEAVQHRNYAAAYGHFGAALRADLPFNLYSKAMTFSESGFRAKPSVERIRYEHGFVRVRLRLPFSEVRTPENPQSVTFVMDHEDDRWVITKDDELRLTELTGPFEPLATDARARWLPR